MFHFLSVLSLLVLFLALSFTTIATTPMSVPPLQWINLSPLASGSAPAVSRDSVMGYDPNTRNLMIFGGQSDLSGFVSRTTYLLNLDTLAWTQSSPALPTLTEVPPARSKAIGGADFAANARQSFLMYGGMDSSGNPLNDVWSYSYANQFWHQTTPTGSPPPARWGAAGGSDETISLRDPNPANFQNTFYVYGGSSSTSTDPLSDLWQLTMDGTLSANALSTTASWAKIDWKGTLPAVTGAGSTVLPNEQVVTYGGCSSATISGGVYNDSCAQQKSLILDIKDNTNPVTSNCPSPRFAPSVVPNYNQAVSAFSTQIFLLFGGYDRNKWNDSASLQNGEVAVFDTAASTWSFVLPSGDPDSSPGFPSAREGAAALSYPLGLVGDATLRAQWSDTLVFGGQDLTTGALTNDLWLLRSYSGSVSFTGERWAGWNTNKLQGGKDADGQGVTMTFSTQCATAIELQANGTLSTSSTSPVTAVPTATQGSSNVASSLVIDTSTVHKVLSPVAVAILLAAFLILRPVSVEHQTHDNYTNFRLVYSAVFLATLSIVSSIVGMIFAFTKSKVMQGALTQSDSALRGVHGKVGLTLSLLLYAMLLLLAILSSSSKVYKNHEALPNIDGKDVASITPSRPSTTMQSYADQMSRPSSPDPVRARTKSGGSTLVAALPWPLIQKVRSRRSLGESDEPSPEASKTPQSKGFEVVNRPKNLRSQTHTPGMPSTSSQRHLPRNLSEINWLERRRSLNATGELDYALSQHHNQQSSSRSRQLDRPSTRTGGSTHPLISPSPLIYHSSPTFISPFAVIGRLAYQLLILANVVFTLVALWRLQSLAPFVIFLAWSIIVYLIMVVLAWYNIPRSSVLALFISTTRTRQRVASKTFGDKTNFLSTPVSPIDQVSVNVMEPSTGPYMHQPPIRRTASTTFDYPPNARMSPRHVEDEPDDDEEDDEKQERIEREMQRRDVSIITVPRRQLRIANL